MSLLKGFMLKFFGLTLTIQYFANKNIRVFSLLNPGNLSFGGGFFNSLVNQVKEIQNEII